MSEYVNSLLFSKAGKVKKGLVDSIDIDYISDKLHKEDWAQLNSLVTRVTLTKFTMN